MIREWTHRHPISIITSQGCDSCQVHLSCKLFTMPPYLIYTINFVSLINFKKLLTGDFALFPVLGNRPQSILKSYFPESDISQSLAGSL